MKTKQRISILVFITFVCSFAGITPAIANEKKTGALYESIIKNDDVAMLNLFFTQMPKGGDLHHHYTGSLYAETYLDWVKEKNWFIDNCSFKIVPTYKKLKDDCQLMKVDALKKDNSLYRNLLTLWSDKDYKNHYHSQPSPDTNFFNTFSYFGGVSHENLDLGLKILKNRAINENVSYIETMLAKVGVKSAAYFNPDELTKLNTQLRNASSQNEVNALLESISLTLTHSNSIEKQVDQFILKTEKIHAGIDDNNFTMRFQTYAARTQSPVQVFTDLFSGYLAVKRSPLFVGVNIVAAENNPVSLADYTLHMQMYNYLLTKYPTVNRALHAGELTLGMVRPKNLNFHIKQARDIAKAQRIGHGVDLPYEKNSIALLEDLKHNAAIEINLTSNAFILGVERNEHPYLIYSSYGVPIVISTDDSGVSRNNLSHEYMLLASRYKPSYKRIKKYVYNSIKYSFLKNEDKVKNIKILDENFTVFESKMQKLLTSLHISDQ